MEISNEMALIVRLANTLWAMLDDMRAAADSSEDPSLAHSFLDGYTRMLNEAQHYISSHRSQVEGRVYLTDLDHIAATGKASGLVEVQEELEKALNHYGKAISGVGLAKTIVDGLLSEHKLRLLNRNFLLAIEHGLDVQNGALALGADHTGYYLHILTDTDE